MRAPLLLVSWRKSLAINATESAARLGISGSALSDYEHGRRTPRIKVALQIEKRTGGSVPIESWGEVPADEESGTLVATDDEPDPITGTHD